MSQEVSRSKKRTNFEEIPKPNVERRDTIVVGDMQFQHDVETLNCTHKRISVLNVDKILMSVLTKANISGNVADRNEKKA